MSRRGVRDGTSQAANRERAPAGVQIGGRTIRVDAAQETQRNNNNRRDSYADRR
jgi:hypothetical protein